MGPSHLPASITGATKHRPHHGHLPTVLSARAGGVLSRLNLAHCFLTGHVVDAGECPRCARKALA